LKVRECIETKLIFKFHFFKQKDTPLKLLTFLFSWYIYTVGSIWRPMWVALSEIGGEEPNLQKSQEKIEHMSYIMGLQWIPIKNLLDKDWPLKEQLKGN